MQFINTTLVFIGLFTLALAADDGLGLPHPLVPFQYNGTLGGHEVQLIGTIQSIYSQMKELYPDFELEHTLQNYSDASTIVARDVTSKSDRNCCPIAGQNWGWAQADPIETGINYLNGIDICGAPANSCVRISCSWNAAIYLCNDNGWGITPKCNYIASYASDLVSNCLRRPAFQAATVCGQEFDTDGYNVIVHNDRC